MEREGDAPITRRNEAFQARSHSTGGRRRRMRSQPAITLLSNGSYGVMLTSAGGGASTWRDLDVSRWREDATRDCWGQFYYVRDLRDNSAWSIGAQPLARSPDTLEFESRADRGDLRRTDGDIE